MNDAPSAVSPIVLERARGRAEVGFVARDGATRLDRLFQEGQAKIRIPRPFPGEPPTAVLINTGGGIAGGDRIAWGVDVGAGAHAVAVSQAAERIHRSSPTDGGLSGEIATRITVGAGGRLDWLPQETILFDRAALVRRLDVDLAEDASALLVEPLVLGRTAMGEEVETCRLADHWRIRRGGRLVFADGFRLEGAARAVLAGRATGDGARAFAQVVIARPDAEREIDAIRDLLAAEDGPAGATAFDGLVCIRLANRSALALRTTLVRLIVHIRRAEMPRVWSC